MRTIECEMKLRTYTERCLALALNDRMTNAEGKNWFATLASNEDKVRAEKENHAVIKANHKSIEQCDFQAILKILFFRETYRNHTFPPHDNKEDIKIRNALSNLIDFRNSDIAHVSVLEEKQSAPGEYSFDNAILDMVFLLHYFPTLQGPAPKAAEDQPGTASVICYYEEAKKIFETYQKTSGQRDYKINDAIQKYTLKVTEEKFVAACKKLNIVIFYPKDSDGWYFSSSNPDEDIKRIQEHFKLKEIEQELSTTKREKEKAQRIAQQAQKRAAATRQDNNSRTQSKIRYIFFAIIIFILIISFVACSSIINGIKNIFNFGNIADDNDTNIDNSTSIMIEEEIENFVSTARNTLQLTIGEKHKPQESIWLMGDDKRDICYSTNEAVVTVTSGGIVKAVGEGEAFVVIGHNTMFAVYKYTVSK